MEKIKSFIKKDPGKFYKLAFVLSLLVIISLCFSLLTVKEMDNKRMVAATDSYMISLKSFSYWIEVYLEDPSREDLQASQNHLTSAMGSYMAIASPSKGSSYEDLREGLSKLAQINHYLSFQHFPKAANQEENLKIQKLVQAYKDLVNFYYDSGNGGFYRKRFENYKDLVTKLEDLNQTIIKDFNIKESDL
ncbi:MAG: hypothetical protein Q4E36_02095 [Bacillota bacterium]|nr:hypothetical protein [Bacillota bacterium]